MASSRYLLDFSPAARALPEFWSGAW
jgi:hypothetical protein